MQVLGDGSVMMEKFLVMGFPIGTFSKRDTGSILDYQFWDELWFWKLIINSIVSACSSLYFEKMY